MTSTFSVEMRNLLLNSRIGMFDSLLGFFPIVLVNTVDL